MKKLILILAVIAAGCGDTKEQKDLQRRLDSIKMQGYADSLRMEYKFKLDAAIKGE